MTELPLAGLRVVDMADEKGELCGRLLADLGAEVVRVEPPGGAISRRLPPFAPDGTSLYFALRNANKRGVIVDLRDEGGRETFDRLLADADVWIESERPGELAALGLDHAAVLSRHPGLVITSITDFGQTGPYRDFTATDAVMVGLSGMLFRSGVPERPPLLPPGALAYDVASTTATFATLAACWQRLTTGRGQLIDCSVMEAVAQISDWALPNYGALSAAGGTYGEIRSGSGAVYPLYPCADGFVRLIILSPRQWRSMRAWLGEPETLQDDHWDHILSRMSIQADILDPMYLELFSTMKAADLAAEAQRRGIVMTPVMPPGDVLHAPHYEERRTFVVAEVAPGVTGPIASGFFEFDHERVGFRHRAPQPGEHAVETGAGAERPAQAPAAQATAGAESLPFTGLKVLDFGHGGVGVETGRLLAEYGADVIKVESRSYPDFIRTVSGSEMSPSFASSSRVKRSFGVNVKTDRGLEIAKRLVEWADVIIENSSTGTMQDMGLAYDTVRALNPRVVMVSSQLMGSWGPWANWIGYGPSTRPIGGMTYLWNFKDGDKPPGSGAIHPDHLVGRMAAIGGLAALLGRERSGTGAHVEVPQVETLIGLLGDLFLQEGLAPGSVQPQGNSSERGAPWGVYPCDGEQRWCVITVRDDDEWSRLRAAIGDPDWAGDDRFGRAAGRIEHRDELDELLAGWTSGRSDREVMELLQAEQVPAGMMLYASDMPTDPHLVARGYPRPVEQPGVGPMIFEGPAFHASEMADVIVRHAPALGEHTREIARDLLGMSDEEIEQLVTEAVLEE